MTDLMKKTVGKAGRPSRGEMADRREQLLAKALELFAKQGFAGTSLDEIASHAHVAKRTIYEQFGGKEELFAATIEQAATALISRFPIPKARCTDLKQDLQEMGCLVLDYVLQPRSLAIYRLVVGESGRQPKLARLFYEHGPARVISCVVSLIASYLPEGAPEPVCLARDFIAQVVLEKQQRALMGFAGKMDRAEIADEVARNVTTFLATLQT
jgi:AcrR family transcriptional regulator